MLKNLDPLLTPDLLYVLRAMGHGDVLTLVDSNFPADSVASSTIHGEVIRLDGVGTTEAARAIETPLQYMQVVGEPDTKLEVHEELHQAALEGTDRDWNLSSVERFDFYDLAHNTYAVVATCERRPYGCFFLTKGVIGPDGQVV